ncbi:MAG: tocopherol cyclase [Flavobacteriaceae bacterium]|jgi:tocopherol cyclase|tara:strand:- start:2530 stop:3501 length:972 start_codon:yes stop_codon:yes gene_type:complete
MMNYKFHAVWHPECYHGWGRTKRFFEGWYYKVVSENQRHAMAIIPGIAMDKNGKKQAFIQVLDGKNLNATYHRFEAKEFQPTPKKHSLKIKNNFFSEKKIFLDLPELKGELIFENLSPWPNSFFSPGIMGPFSFVPFMECYHGILSMNHSIKGALMLNGQTLLFDKGRGYIEKDWGYSFPEGYIWMQSNHFSQKETSIKISVAKIPWLRSSFIGYIAGLMINGRLIQFTTYNRSKLRNCKVNQKEVRIVMENIHYRLSVVAQREKATSLAAPILGFMNGRIEESLNAKIHTVLLDKKTNKILFDDIGLSAGIEVAGNYQLLLK